MSARAAAAKVSASAAARAHPERARPPAGVGPAPRPPPLRRLPGAVAAAAGGPCGRRGPELGGVGGCWRAKPRSRAGASLPASAPGSGSRPAGTRNRSCAGKLGVGSGSYGPGREPAVGRRSGLGVPPPASRWLSYLEEWLVPAKPCGFDLMSLFVECASQR